ncbi:MAG: Rpn family recombination-promoting nuclease/putative transposase [Alicyclobacillaceae bacterium]|nr:Rpn family recombination-promoting nuclease/putative transposase [Alicyclobacillaceae bacterium]
MMPLMDLKVDFAFKQLFGKQGNEPILIAFLNATLKLPKNECITFIEILNSELEPNHLDDKKSVLDIHARTENGARINIEIQLANRYDMEKRTLYYWSRIYSGQLNEGMGYKELAKTITINILNFRFVKPTERYHTTFHLFEDEEKFLLTDVLEIHFMEIPKLMVNWRKKALNLHEDLLVRWLLLLEAGENEDIRRELEAIAMQDSVMKKAFAEWEDISRNPRAWAEYESRRKAILDDAAAVREAELRAQEAEEKGALIGALHAAENIARNLLLSGMDVETVAEHTGLSKEKVADIQRNVH